LNKWWRYGLWTMLAAAVLTAAHLAFWQRYMVERDYRQVELAVNYDEISALAGEAGLTPLEGLKEFKKHAVTAVVLREPTLDDLVVNGDVERYPGQKLLSQLGKENAPGWLAGLAAKTSVAPDKTYLVIYNRDMFNQVSYQLAAKLAGVKSYQIADGTYVIETLGSYLSIKGLGVGFSGTALADVQNAGMRAILQIRDWDKATRESIAKVFQSYRNISNVSAVMFNDDIPGYPSMLPELAEQIRQLDVPLVQVEFLVQPGINKLGILVDKRVLRLHTVPQSELKNLTPSQVLDRYTLAAAERNHRILYYRPVIISGDLMQENLHFIDKIRDRLEREGLQVGAAGLLPPVPVYRSLAFLIGLGVIAGGLLLLERLGLGRLKAALGPVAVLLWAALLYVDFVTARKFMALAAVIVFPTLSLLLFVKKEGLTPGAAVWNFIRISLFSLLGALFMVGLLADAGFMLKLDQFAGVKLAHLAPLLIVLAYFSLHAARGVNMAEKVKGLLGQPVLLGVALAGAFMALAVLIYVARTGNDAGLEVSGLELQFRSLLDQILGVRPRTKEFLLGHPALLLVLLYGYRDNRFLPLLLLGAIGQASLVNTFAHIHTPLLVSLIRACHGIWLGILLGLAVYFFSKLVYRYGRGVLNG